MQVFRKAPAPESRGAPLASNQSIGKIPDLLDELKKRRAMHAESADLAEWKKMHQFIEKHAKTNLEKHITKITVLLEASTSPSHFLELFATVFYGRQQLLLITPDIRDEFS